jgi:hypothetical protein
LASVAFLASSSLYASPAVSPACNAWPKMAVKDANPSGVLVLIADSSEALKWSATIFLNLSSLLSPPLDPEPLPPILAIAIRNSSLPKLSFDNSRANLRMNSNSLKDFRQFRACDVIRIVTCDTLFLAKESGFKKWLTYAFLKVVQCC